MVTPLSSRFDGQPRTPVTPASVDSAEVSNVLEQLQKENEALRKVVKDLEDDNNAKTKELIEFYRAQLGEDAV